MAKEPGGHSGDKDGEKEGGERAQAGGLKRAGWFSEMEMGTLRQGPGLWTFSQPSQTKTFSGQFSCGPTVPTQQSIAYTPS